MKSSIPGEWKRFCRVGLRDFRAPAAYDGDALTTITMQTPMTPEHLQLLSTSRLTAAAEKVSESDETSTTDSSMAQMARFELRRRACDVPVNHRYASVRWRQAETKK